MQQTLITIFSILISLGALIFYLFNWLRADLKEVRQDIKTHLRLRVDTLPPPDSPGPDQVNQAA